MFSTPDIDWRPAEKRPEDNDSDPTLQEFHLLRGRLSQLQSLISGQKEIEHPDFNLWFGDKHLVLSANLPGLEPDSVRVALARNVLYLRGSHIRISGQESAQLFERTFVLPYLINPVSIRVNWVMGYLLIEADRLPDDKTQAA